MNRPTDKSGVITGSAIDWAMVYPASESSDT